jgi:hypothetical protein
MAAVNRALLLKELRYIERHIAADAESIEKQRAFVEQLEASGRGESTTAPTARALLATMQAAQRGHLADRERIKRLLAQ